jgi:hypothetical protein
LSTLESEVIKFSSGTIKKDVDEEASENPDVVMDDIEELWIDPMILVCAARLSMGFVWLAIVCEIEWWKHTSIYQIYARRKDYIHRIALLTAVS